MADFVRAKEGFRFKFNGMRVNDTADSLPPDKYPIAANIRGYRGNTIRTRPGQTLKFQCATHESILGMRAYTQLETDNLPRLLAVGADFTVFDDTGTAVGAVVAGDPEGLPAGVGVSMIPVRPNASPAPYMYIANGNTYIKLSAPPVVQSLAGIKEPQVAPGAVLSDIEQVGVVSSGPAWVNAGTAGSASPGTRVSDTCGVVLTDPNNSGTAPWSIQVTSADSYQQNMPLAIASNTGIVMDVFAPLRTALAIQSIFYFAGTTGRCIIVPNNLAGDQTAEEASIYAASILASLRRGAIIKVGTEYCYVWSSTIGPNGSVSIETSTTSNHTTADTLNSVPAIQIMGGGVPVLGASITAGSSTYAVTTGIGTQSVSLGGFNPFVTSGGVSFQPDDYITFGVLVDHPENLNEIDILFDVGDGSFTENYFYYAIRPSALADYLADLQTQLATVQEIEQQAIIDALDPTSVNNQLQSATSAQAAPGITQWTQIIVPLTSFTRVGSDDTKTLQNINGVQIKVNASANVNVATAEMDVIGSFQPDVGDAGAPYLYRVRPRSSVTGAIGNPSPQTRYGVSPRRSQVLINLPSAAYDGQIDTWDIFRYGGSVTSWRWIGQIASTASQFFDNFSDNAANGGDALDFDNFEPWPSVDVPNNGTANSVTGTTAIVSTTDTDILRYLPGTLVQLGAQNVYTLYTRPTAVIGSPGKYLLQFVENAGAGMNVLYQINEPLLANQHAAYLFGPDAAGTVFSCGDVFRPGTLSFSKNYAPDSVPDTYNIELTPPSEPLLGGEVLDGLAFVASPQRWWALYPQPDNPSQRYNPVQQPFPRGLAAPFGHCTDGRSIYWWAKDGIWSSTQGSLTDADLSTLFPHEGIVGSDYTYGGVTISAPDYSRAATFRLSYANGFLYATYQTKTAQYLTLVCDLRNGRVAWSIDLYAPTATYFYQPEQPAAAANSNTRYDELLIATVDGRVATQTTLANDLGGAIPCSLATMEFDGGDMRASEQWGDLWLDATPNAPINITPMVFGKSAAPTQIFAQNVNRTQLPVSVGGELTVDFLGNLLTWIDDYTKQSSETRIHIWQPSFLVKPETIADRFSDWDDAGIQGAKWWQGFILHADTNNVVKGIAIRDADTLTTHSFTPVVQHNGESELAYSFNQPFIAHMVRIEPTDQLLWRLFEVRWVAEPTPEVAETWQTQFSTHGLMGYMHLRQLSLTYASAQPVTFQATSYDGTSPAAVTLPATGGAVQKIVFPFTFNKGQMYSYRATCSTPFQVYSDKSEVLIGQWGRESAYQNVPLVGSVGGDKATI